MGIEEIALRPRAAEIVIDVLGHQTIGIGLAAHEGDGQLGPAFLIGDVTDDGRGHRSMIPRFMCRRRGIPSSWQRRIPYRDCSLAGIRLRRRAAIPFASWKA